MAYMSAPGARIAARIEAASSGVTTSSVSSERIQSVDNWAIARFFCGPKPGQSGSTTTRAPWARAISTVASVLPPSISTTSSAKSSEARQSERRAAAFSAISATPRVGSAMREGRKGEASGVREYTLRRPRGGRFRAPPRRPSSGPGFGMGGRL